MNDIKTMQIYEILKIINNTKNSKFYKIPFIENDDSFYKINKTFTSIINDEHVYMKIKDYGYCTESISKLPELINFLNIDFSLEDVSYDCISNIYLKLKDKYIKEQSLCLFFVSELFIKILITFEFRKEIYKEGVYHSNKTILDKTDNVDPLQEIIDFWSINKLTNQQKFRYLFSDPEAKNNYFDTLFIENHLLINDSLEFLKEYIKYNNDNYIIESCYNTSFLKEMNIQEVAVDIIIDNIFIKKNVIISHFNFSILSRSNNNSIEIILYLINKIGLFKVKELYINNITIKNESLKYIVDLLIMKYSDDIKHGYSFNKINIYMDEKTQKIYYKNKLN